MDSTLLDDAVAAAVELSAHDYDTAGKPAVAWDDPVAKAALVSGLVNDALAILEAVDGVDLDDGQRATVGLLAQVGSPWIWWRL